jgi:hypothetical protein
MVASVDVISLLEGIDTSTPAPRLRPTWPCALTGCSTPATVRPRHVLVFSLVALSPFLVIGLTTLLPLDFCAHCLPAGAHRQQLALSSSRSLECFISSYAGLQGP